jgi:hypothetical protein
MHITVHFTRLSPTVTLQNNVLVRETSFRLPQSIAMKYTLRICSDACSNRTVRSNFQGAIAMETFVFRATVRDGGNRFDHTFLRIVVSKDIVFVASSNSLSDPSDHHGGAGHLGLLASEDMVIVLAFTLAVIIVAIVIIIIVILALRRRNSSDGGLTGGRRRPGRNGIGGFTQGWGGGANGGRGAGCCSSEEKMQLSGPKAIYDVDHSCSNGTLAYCNSGGSSCGGGKSSLTTADCNGSLLNAKGNGMTTATTGNGCGKKWSGGVVANGNGVCKVKQSNESDRTYTATSKATAVVNAYVALDKMAASSSDDDVKSHVTCVGDRQANGQVRIFTVAISLVCEELLCRNTDVSITV